METSGFAAMFSFNVEEVTELYLAEKAEIILREGDESDGRLYFLVSGKAKLYSHLLDGSISLIKFLQPGSFIGEMEILGVRSETLEIKMLTDGELFSISMREHRETILSDNQFLRNLCFQLASFTNQTVHDLKAAQRFPLRNRLAKFLLDASIDGWFTERGNDTAAYLGVTYRHLTLVMKELSDMGYIERKRGQCFILDEEGLKALAEYS